ncbi:hypothetical protein IWQ62_003308 [Dispira parvispora]|uniref:Arrestin-like N-terminal domain-containing protein n=1 Tax=Dispira parvispora TaxID=1520584 RepID=A0A9W8E6E5_9FUNG|nr:hypothetical protein IWQ62_003308 [Dispira parvispora]
MFEIRFPSYSGIPRCRPDTILTGVVLIKNTCSISPQSLVLCFRGVERINSGPVINATDTSSTTTLATNQWLEQVYFEKQTVLLGNEKGGDSPICTIEPGLHLYHFACQMPLMNYPTSVRSPMFEILYTLVACLHCPDDAVPVKYSIPTSVQFEPLALVTPPLPLAVKSQSSNLLDGNRLLYHVHANFLKNSLGPGESFSVNLTLKPATFRPIKKAHLSLVEYTQCYLRHELDTTEKPLWTHQRVLHQEDLLLHRIRSGIGQNPYVATVSFELPECFQPNNSLHLTFGYTLRLTVKVATGFFFTGQREAVTEIPVVIFRPDDSATVSHHTPSKNLPGALAVKSMKDHQRYSSLYTRTFQPELLRLPSARPSLSKLHLQDHPQPVVTACHQIHNATVILDTCPISLSHPPSPESKSRQSETVPSTASVSSTYDDFSHTESTPSKPTRNLDSLGFSTEPSSTSTNISIPNLSVDLSVGDVLDSTLLQSTLCLPDSRGLYT